MSEIQEGTHRIGVAYIIIDWNRHHPHTGSEPVCLPMMSKVARGVDIPGEYVEVPSWYATYPRRDPGGE
jgi:hypothetical protein